jgi:cellulose synthase/poly-beta-1,6-N-acetylglucosamine synthase-like glycosyltransferase
VVAGNRSAHRRRRLVHGAPQLSSGPSPRVSILLPCRDAAAWLDQAVASLAAQTFPDFEILAVDDGSRDRTPALLERWAAQDGRVRVLRSGGAGIVAALRTGLAHVRGELVARMDADDLAQPDRFAAQIELLDAQPDVAACGTRVRYFPGDVVRDGARRYEAWLNGLTTPAAIVRDAFVECPIAHPTLLIRRSVLDGIGGWRDVGWPEDYDLVLRLLAAGHALANVPRVLLDWRERPDRLSRTDPRYGQDAFHRCKAHYLTRGLARGRRIVIVGGGPVGKAFARALQAEGAAVAGFIDLDPRRIGQTIHGAPVASPDALDAYADAFAVAAVSGAAARADIRAWLDANGRVELTDYCAVA